MSGYNDAPHTLTETENNRGTVIRVGQQWEDNSRTRDPIRRFTVIELKEEYGHISAICRITHGIDRTTGKHVPIDREVAIAIDRLHPVQGGYRQIVT